jgi:hypothetical protein
MASKKPYRGRMVGTERKKAQARVSQRSDKALLDSISGILRRNPTFRNKYLSQWNTERSGRGVKVTHKERGKK